MKISKNPCCSCPVINLKHPSGETTLIITHKETCSWIKDCGLLRITVLGKNGEVIKNISFD